MQSLARMVSLRCKEVLADAKEVGVDLAAVA